MVTVASVAHGQGRLDFDDLQSRRDYSGYTAYAASKLANVSGAGGGQGAVAPWVPQQRPPAGAWRPQLAASGRLLRARLAERAAVWTESARLVHRARPA
ncbi:MAG: hypothetical protein IPK12_11420 [Gemmatimonadetes bacterium]|nr:hypothetical protein [Gemmatimonadota bacterium]